MERILACVFVRDIRPGPGSAGCALSGSQARRCEACGRGAAHRADVAGGLLNTLAFRLILTGLDDRACTGWMEDYLCMTTGR